MTQIKYMPEQELKRFNEWYNNSSIKDIPAEEFTPALIERALAYAYSQGCSDRLDSVTDKYNLTHKDYECSDCGEIKEDCICLEPVYEDSDRMADIRDEKINRRFEA